MPTTARRRWRGAALVLGTVAMVAACGSDDDSSSGSDAPAEEAGAADGVLAGVCPETVVIQADWEPESEHGGVYQLLGDDYEINTEAKSVTGPLVAGGRDTGVDVEIRIGGASISYQPVQSVLYQDSDVFMGYVRVSETMASQDDTPVVSVMAAMDKSPFAIYWDPETYPDVERIADLKAAGVKVFMSGEADVWQDYLVAEGILDASQLDRSEADKPASFVAAGGRMAEAGFASAEPYMYEFEVPEWGRPVKLELIHDTGYPEYFQALGVRKATVEEEADCLEQLVPILQQAHADYIADPAETNALVVELVEAYDTGWIYTAGMADWSVDQQAELGIVGNGDDSTIGDFDEERVQQLLDITGEVTDVDMSGYSPGDFVTNDFIDTSIGAEG